MTIRFGIGRYPRGRLAAVVLTACLLTRLSGQTPTWQAGANTIYVNPTSTNVGIGITNPATKLDVAVSNAVISYPLRLFNLYGGPSDTNQVGIDFSAHDRPFALITGGQQHAGTYAYGRLDFATRDNDFTIQTKLSILSNGNVGIGTQVPQYKLAVNGTIGAKEVIVSNTGWPDFVFKAGYRLKPLSEVDAYIQEHRHLPDVPSEQDVHNNGVSLGEMQATLLAKIEELTLHMIEAAQRSDRLERQNHMLQNRIRELEQRVGRAAKP